MDREMLHRLNGIEYKLDQLLKGAESMSALDDKITELQTETAAVSANVTAMQGQISTLQSQLASAMASNQAPTQAQLDSLQGIADKLAAIASTSPTPMPAPAPSTP